MSTMIINVARADAMMVLLAGIGDVMVISDHKVQ